MKKILFIMALIVLSLGFVWFYVNDNLNTIVRSFILEKVSEATTVEVHLDSVAIHLKEGRAEMYGFVLGNPKPFNKDYAFKFSSAKITLNTGSLFKDTIIIDKVILEGAQIYYERNGRQSNFNALTKAMRQQDQLSENLDKNPVKLSRNGKAGHERKFIIRRVEFSETLAELAIPGLAKKSISLKIPDMLLEGIGESEGGVSPDALSNLIITAIEEQLVKSNELMLVTKEVDKALRSVEEVKGKLKKGTKEIKRIESQFKKIKDLKDLF